MCSFSPTPDPTADGSSNSLRAAIIAANASGQDCTIQLQAGTYTLTIRNPTSGRNKGQDNTGAYGDLDITDSGHTVTVQGQGAGGSIVNGNGIDRVFQVLGGANAAFKNLTIEGGSAQDNGVAGVLPGTTPAMGGGLLVQDGGHVTLSGVTIKGNQAIGGNGAGPTSRHSAPNGPPGQAAEGGGLFLSTGTVDLTDCKISGNTSKGGNGGDGQGGFRRTSAGYGGAGATAAGGGLYVLSGNAGLLRSTLSGNRAAGGVGGRGGTAVDSPFFNGGNGGPAQGAGLFIRKGVLHLAQTTLSNNTATGGGGGAAHSSDQTIMPFASGGSSQGAGIFVVGGNISLENSTLFANAAKGGNGGSALFCPAIVTGGCPPKGIGGNAAGGGLYISRGAASLVGVTVASNQALTGFEQGFRGSSFGGGIANGGAISLLTNTTLLGENEQDSGSTANGDDVSGPITASFSLFSQAAGAAITDNGGNIFNVDPALDPDGLRPNGGPTQTVALEIGSPAIDAGDNAVCAAPGPAGLGSIDQRGVARFHHGDNLCDIGAFEFINLLVQPNRLNYGSVHIGIAFGMNAYVTNNQTTSVTLSETIGGADPGDFSLAGGNCHGSLAANASCTLWIYFGPTATGKRSGLLTVSDSPDRTSPYQVPLIGIGK